MANRLDPSKGLLVFSCALSLFAYGVAVGRYELFPFAALQFGQDSLTQVFEERDTILGLRPHGLIAKARYAGNGVTRFQRDKSVPGLTFVASFYDDANELRLMRSDGSVVRRWPVKFSEIFPDRKHIEPEDRIPKTDWDTELHGALVLPDGSVVFNFEGMGLVKLDRCGSVQWTLPRMTHHSVERSADGAFWVSGMRYVTDKTVLPPIRPPFHEDTILKVSKHGKVLEEISLAGLLLKNKLHGLLFVRMPRMDIPFRDLTHLNDIEELTRDMASHFPQFAPGDLLISIRELNTIMVVDPTSELVKWYQTGPWMGQHDPDFLTNGRISVFSNNDDGTATGSVLGGSTIFEVDPARGVTRLTYGESSDQRSFTSIRGKHQTFANGNKLITESNAGRVFEVSANGEIVWEYINRFDEEYTAIVFEGARYPEHYFTVDDWQCTSGAPDRSGIF
jgi:hypothetical protein